jgi:hypothetical protein
MLEKRNRSLIVSYIALRRLIGVLGMLLPLICVLGGLAFAGLSCQRSISFYYHSNMRDFFVGLMVAVSMFLVTYKGYQARDTVVTTLGGLSGIGIALFPVRFSRDIPLPIGLFQLAPAVSNILHVACAAVFFALLAVNSIFLFTLSGEGAAPATGNKKIRNGIYIACGLVILVSMAAFAALYLILGEDKLNQGNLVLVLESVMLLAFGISWLVKGETLWRDRKERAEAPSSSY